MAAMKEYLMVAAMAVRKVPMSADLWADNLAALKVKLSVVHLVVLLALRLVDHLAEWLAAL